MKKTLLFVFVFCFCLSDIQAGKNDRRYRPARNHQDSAPATLHLPITTSDQAEPEKTRTPEQEFLETPKEPTPRASANFLQPNINDRPSMKFAMQDEEQEDLFADVISQLSKTPEPVPASTQDPKSLLNGNDDDDTQSEKNSLAMYQDQPFQHLPKIHTGKTKKHNQLTKCHFEGEECFYSSDSDDDESQYQVSTLEQIKTMASKTAMQLMKYELDILLSHDNTGTIEALFKSFGNDTERISTFVFNASSQAIKRQNLSEIITIARFIKQFELQEYVTPKQASDFHTALSASHEIIKLVALFENPAHSDPTKSPRAITTTKHLQTLARQYNNKLSPEQLSDIMKVLQAPAKASSQ